MSIAVTLDELPGQLAELPWGYLLTVADDGRPRVRAVPTVWDDGVRLTPTSAVLHRSALR